MNRDRERHTYVTNDSASKSCVLCKISTIGGERSWNWDRSRRQLLPPQFWGSEINREALCGIVSSLDDDANPRPLETETNPSMSINLEEGQSDCDARTSEVFNDPLEVEGSRCQSFSQEWQKESPCIRSGQ